MYKTVETQDEVAKCLPFMEDEKKRVFILRSLLSTVAVFNHPEGYLVCSQSLSLSGESDISLELTDEPKILQTIVGRESGGERALSDENLEKALELLRHP